MSKWRDSWGVRVLACVMTLVLTMGLLPTSAFVEMALADDTDDQTMTVVNESLADDGQATTVVNESLADDVTDNTVSTGGEQRQDTSQGEDKTIALDDIQLLSVEDDEGGTDNEDSTDDVPIMVGQSYSDPKHLSGDKLDGCTVRIRNGRSPYCLSIDDDGNGSNKKTHLYNLPNSFRFYLQKADDDSYYIHYFHNATDTGYSTYANSKVLAVSDESGLAGVIGDDFDSTDCVIHTHDEGTEDYKKFQFIPSGNGMYKIMCKISGKYWFLGDSNNNGQYDDNDEVHQNSSGWDWEIEIINAGGSTSQKGNEHPYETFDTTFRKQLYYDSYSFRYHDDTPVTASDWMSWLPDDTPITDLNIPGTHDTGTCRMEHKTVTEWEAECQTLYIDDQLTAGVRYFDVRCGEMYYQNNVWSPVFNHTDNCMQRLGDYLTVSHMLIYVRAFLAAHPDETVIFQVSKQAGSIVELYEYWRDQVKNSTDFYIGDHLPTLGEARGKIVLLMKINLNSPDFDGSSSPNPNLIYDTDDTTGVSRYWAFDVSPDATISQADYEAAGDSVLVRQESDYEVWIEDDYKVNAQDKWTRSTVPALGNAAKHRDDAMARSKYAWVINYTSCSALIDEETTPISGARYTNHRLKSYFNESMTNYFDTSATDGKYWGVVLMDFVDEQQCQFVYRQNYIMEMPKQLQGEGTEKSPFLIKNAMDWQIFANMVNSGRHVGYAKLDADVTGATAMVGTAEHPFNGVFDGNGHTLSVSIDASEEAAAPFHWISGATIKNLRVEGDVKGFKHTAGLVGYVSDGSINVIQDVTVATTTHMDDKYYCAGIVGHVKQSNTMLRRCVFEGSIEGGEHVGALVGWGDSGCKVVITDCLEKGTTYTAPNVNPIALLSDWATVTDTYALSDVKGTPKQNTEGAVKVYAEKPEGASAEVVACDGNTYYLPVEIEVSVKTNRKSITVDSEKLKGKAAALFTADEMEQAKNGAKLKVWLDIHVTAVISEVSASDVTLLQKRADALGSSLGEYATVLLYKQVGDGAATRITELPEGMDAIQMSWTVPQELRASGRSFGVMSVHDGKVLEYTTTTKDNVVSFGASKFSTFTLTQKDTKSSDSGSGVPKQATQKSGSGTLAKTGDETMPMALVLAMALAGALCVAGGSLARRRERE